MFAERRAHGGGGAVAIVGQRLHDDRAAAGAIALIAHFLVIFIVARRCLVDRALNIVLGHGLRLGRIHRKAQTRVHVHIGRAHLGRDRDFTAELGKQIGAFFVLRTLAVHDILEFGMACHEFSATAVRVNSTPAAHSPMRGKTSTLTDTKSATMSDAMITKDPAPEPVTTTAAPVAAPSMAAEWRQFAAFVKRPVLPQRAAPLKAGSFVAIGRMWALDIILMGALVTLAMIVVGFGLELPENALGQLEWTAATIAMIVLVAPVSEEILFRGWLSGRPGHVLGLLVLGLGLYVVATFGASGGSAGAITGVAAMIFAGVIAITLIWKLGDRPPMPWFAKLFPAFFWLSTVAFALVHLVNYDEGSLAFLLPFVIPQFIAGMIFAYMRVHYGLWSAIAQHALHNATALSVVLMAGEMAGDVAT